MRDAQGRIGRLGTWLAFGAVLAAIGLCTAAAVLAMLSVNYAQRYVGRIYPGVDVYGVDLSGMSVDEATSALSAALPDPTTLPLTLRSGDQAWDCQWADLGVHFDPSATAQLAYRVGREGTPEEQAASQLRTFVGGRTLPPVVVLPDPALANRALEAMASELLVPPVNAGLLIQADGISVLPAQAGRELDLQETVALLQHAFGFGPQGLTLELLTRQVEPAIMSPGPVLAQAQALLSQTLILSGTDMLAHFSGTWPVPSSVVADSLDVRSVEDENGAWLELTVSDDALRAYLEDLNGKLAEDIAIDIEATLPVVRAALETMQTQATATLIHPLRIYTIQAGDTLMSIARGHGFPVWRLIEANSAIDPKRLRPGQEVTIPSVDVLFPLPLVEDRRIVVDISEQRLFAYEGTEQVFDFVASTGIASSPTVTGTFQVLNKEENAYASSWDLWMPHFIGVYRSGPDFTNGIHGLPTLSSGATLWAGYLGRPVSYGCIVLGLEDAAAIYEWSELGTLVLIQE